MTSSHAPYWRPSRTRPMRLREHEIDAVCDGDQPHRDFARALVLIWPLCVRCGLLCNPSDEQRESGLCHRCLWGPP